MRALRYFAVAAIVAAGCATNPATGRRQLILVSEAQEIQMGRESDAAVRQQMGVYDDPALQDYVNRIGQRLARQSHRPDLPWTFTVVNEPAVNAFALPGGFIYVTRGILPYMRNEAELAAVIGHEVGHVDAQHSVEAISRQTLGGGALALGSIFLPEGAPQAAAGLAGIGLQAVFLKYSREAELEADELGVGYTARAGWAPSAMAGMLGTLARLDAASGSSRGIPNWALTHPPAADREQRVEQLIATTPAPASPVTNEAEFDRRIDGMVFGDSREKGMVRGNEFVHPVLRFAVRFPEGWEIVNGDDQVSAYRDPNGNLAMVLQLVQNATGSVEETAARVTSNSGYRLVSGERTRINGLDAYVGTYEGTVQQATMGLRIAHIRAANQTYVIAGIAPASQYGGVQPTFSSAIQTFRELSAQEAAAIQPNRIDFYTVRAGQTWDAIARGPSGGRISAASLAIMNGAQPGSAPRAGDRIRIVVGG
ncbi:MAG: M48 family metalloprotease [Vicinamibacterales bacterium]